jgi:hypothetical protein
MWESAATKMEATNKIALFRQHRPICDLAAGGRHVRSRQ